MPEEDDAAGDLITCPTCMKIWPKGTKFCTQCGTWIETGQVLEPKAPPSTQPPKPAQPPIGFGPPGIGPAGTGQGATPSQPSRFRPSTVPSAPPSGAQPQMGSGIGAGGPEPPPPGGIPGQPPPAHLAGAPGMAGAEGAPGAEAPKKKYSLMIEPPREERVPGGPMFIPKREERKKKGVGIRQVIIVIICLLAIAYAVISMAFKPLHGFLMGKAFELVGKPELAIKYYRKAANSDGMWAEPATKAMTRIARGVFKRHLETQFYGNWTAKTKITIQGRTGPAQLESEIAYKAPGFVSEKLRIAGSGDFRWRRLLNDQMYGLAFGSTPAERLTAAEYGNRVEQLTGLSTSALFDKANANKVIGVLFDDLGMKLEHVIGEGDNKRYQFAIDVAGNEERLRKFEAIMTPLFPWGEWRLRSGLRDITRIQLVMLEKQGIIEQVVYFDANGGVVADQSFEDFQAGASIDDSTFR
jgi:hypothetical protein